MKDGVPLLGKNGVLAPLLENLLNGALEGEMDSHLEGSEREKILADSLADKIIGLYAIQTVSFMKYRVGKTGQASGPGVSHRMA